MRSEQIHRVLEQENNRFQICRLVSRGLKLSHKSGTRIEDSIGIELTRMGLFTAVAPPTTA